MVDLKKIDDKDLVFVNKPLSEKEDREFSEFLRSRKTAKKAGVTRLAKKRRVNSVKK
jgi:hypothetical protein